MLVVHVAITTALFRRSKHLRRPTAGILPLELWLDAKFTAALAGAAGGGGKTVSSASGLPIVVTYAHPALMPHLHKVAAAAAATTTSINSGEEAEEMYYDNSEQQ